MIPTATRERSAPPKGQPAGLWVLIFTETWERWSHYGMRAILILYMTAPAAMGGLGLGLDKAGLLFGGYALAIYLFALSGGLIADRFLGAKRTILLGGILIAAGQIGLQVRNLEGLVASLVLIAIGTCLLKPNVSASVGRLYTPDDPRRDGAFTMEYMGINLGAMIAPFFCAYMAEQPSFTAFLQRLGLHSPSGWAWAFGLSGFGMLLGLANFALRHRLVVDANLPEGAKEPEPRGGLFLVLLLPALLAAAWMVIGGSSWVVQLLGGMAASIGLTVGVSWLLRTGAIRGREAAGPASEDRSQAPRLTPEDLKRLGVVGMMLCFSMTFWAVFQQAGSSLNLFAKDFTQRVVFGFEVPAALVPVRECGGHRPPGRVFRLALDPQGRQMAQQPGQVRPGAALRGPGLLPAGARLPHLPGPSRPRDQGGHGLAGGRLPPAHLRGTLPVPGGPQLRFPPRAQAHEQPADGRLVLRHGRGLLPGGPGGRVHGQGAPGHPLRILRYHRAGGLGHPLAGRGADHPKADGRLQLTMAPSSETSIRNPVAVRDVLWHACDRGGLLLLVTPYVRFESNFLRLDVDAVHVTALMSLEDAQVRIAPRRPAHALPLRPRVLRGPDPAPGPGQHPGQALPRPGPARGAEQGRLPLLLPG